MNQNNTSILLELGDDAWQTHLDRVEQWLGNLLMTQAAFRQLCKDTAKKISEPHIKGYLLEIHETAGEHETRIEELYSIIGRDPAKARKLGGAVLAKSREALADFEGAAGGAAGPWRDLRQLLLANLSAMGAFAVTEQLGLALGLPDIVEITLAVTTEKSTQQLLLQEYVLEMAPVSILYHTPI